MRVIFDWWPQSFYKTHGREATVAWEDQHTAKFKDRKLRIHSNIQTPSRCRWHLGSTGLKHLWKHVHWHTNCLLQSRQQAKVCLQVGTEPHCHLPPWNAIHITILLQEETFGGNYAAERNVLMETVSGKKATNSFFNDLAKVLSASIAQQFCDTDQQTNSNMKKLRRNWKHAWAAGVWMQTRR